MLKNQPKTKIVSSLSITSALCTFAEAIDDTEISGSFGDYLYCVKNGRQILLGHVGGTNLEPGNVIENEHAVFMSKDDGRYRKSVTTWDDLRQHLSDGWVLGTDRKEGVKATFADNGRNNRLQPERIFIFQK